MVHSKAISDGDNQSDHKDGTSDSEQSYAQAASFVSG
jgi:hypothetical protein